MSFENVDDDDDGQWMPAYTISSPMSRSLRLRWAKNVQGKGFPTHFKTLFSFCAGGLGPLVPDKGAARDWQWGSRSLDDTPDTSPDFFFFSTLLWLLHNTIQQRRQASKDAWRTHDFFYYFWGATMSSPPPTCPPPHPAQVFHFLDPLLPSWYPQLLWFADHIGWGGLMASLVWCLRLWCLSDCISCCVLGGRFTLSFSKSLFQFLNTVCWCLKHLLFCARRGCMLLAEMFFKEV